MTFNPLQVPPMPPSSLRHHHSAISMRHNAHEMMERERQPVAKIMGERERGRRPYQA